MRCIFYFFWRASRHVCRAWCATGISTILRQRPLLTNTNRYISDEDEEDLDDEEDEDEESGEDAEGEEGEGGDEENAAPGKLCQQMHS